MPLTQWFLNDIDPRVFAVRERAYQMVLQMVQLVFPAPERVVAS